MISGDELLYALRLNNMWPFKTTTKRLAEYRESHPAQKDDDFVRECGLADSPKSVAIALGVRAAIAELGEIDPTYIRASDRFDEDLVYLPFWGSLDTVGIVIALEKHLGTLISNDEAQRIRDPESEKGVTVAQFVTEVHQMLSARTV